MPMLQSTHRLVMTCKHLNIVNVALKTVKQYFDCMLCVTPSSPSIDHEQHRATKKPVPPVCIMLQDVVQPLQLLDLERASLNPLKRLITSCSAPTTASLQQSVTLQDTHGISHKCNCFQYALSTCWRSTTASQIAKHSVKLWFTTRKTHSSFIQLLAQKFHAVCTFVQCTGSLALWKHVQA